MAPELRAQWLRLTAAAWDALEAKWRHGSGSREHTAARVVAHKELAEFRRIGSAIEGAPNAGS